MSDIAPSFTAPDDLDPRLTPAREDLAASWLKDRVKAPKYVDPQRRMVTASVTNVYRSNDDKTQSIETQLLYGEAIDVFEIKDGCAWVQNIADGYVGYIDASHIGEAQKNAPTHRVSNIGAYIYNTNNVKTTPRQLLSYGSKIAVIGEKEGREKEPLFEIAGGGFIPCAQLSPLDFVMDDPIAEAFRFLGVPRLWGGRSNLGIDCAAHIQLIFDACGIICPRDADQQEAHFGKAIDRNNAQAGDLVFFRGHVGLMVDETTIIHSNDRTASVSIDDLDEYIHWRSNMGKTPVKMFKRVS